MKQFYLTMMLLLLGVVATAQCPSSGFTVEPWDTLTVSFGSPGSHCFSAPFTPAGEAVVRFDNDGSIITSRIRIIEVPDEVFIAVLSQDCDTIYETIYVNVPFSHQARYANDFLVVIQSAGTSPITFIWEGVSQVQSIPFNGICGTATGIMEPTQGESSFIGIDMNVHHVPLSPGLYYDPSCRRKILVQ